MMPKIFFLVTLLITHSFFTEAQNGFETKVMSWNVRWMGSTSYCGCDTALAFQNIKAIIQDENPDIIALQEVINIPQINRLAQNLNMGIAIATYTSLATDTFDNQYKTGQKTVFLYNPSTVEVLETHGLAHSTYPLMSNSNSPYYYFASGRFPQLATFRINANNIEDTIMLINYHAKSGSTSTDWARRKLGAELIFDTLNTQFPQQNKMLLGDLNDLSFGSIITGMNSPYQIFMTHQYASLINPDSFPNQSTYIPISNSLIDNFIVDSNMKKLLVKGKTHIKTNATSIVSDFVNSTSDHYPIVCKLYIDKLTHNSKQLNQSLFSQYFYAENKLYISTLRDMDVNILLFILDGQKIKEEKIHLEYGINKIDYYLPKGHWIISCSNDNNQIQSLKVIQD